MTHEQNLLFAAFAVQLSLTSTPLALQATAAWAADPETDIPERLIRMKALSEEGRATIAELVAAAEAAHHGDTAAALNAAVDDPNNVGRYVHRLSLSEPGEQAGSTAASPEVSEPSTGGQILHETPGRYKGESEYARGGMGRVLLVHDAYLGRDVAMKELLPNISHSGETVSLDAASPVRLSVPLINRFLQEARITGQLEHPSIVPVYELGNRRDGQLYYTMKLVRGETLQKTIRHAADLNARLELLPHFINLCHAIAYAHSRGVLHRDIKPANVMVGEFGETVVLDWGLAKGRGQQDVHEKGFAAAISALNTGGEPALSETDYGQIVGTPAYMSPEQARGQLELLNERSDVYSLGAVLYEILTGATPHTGKDKLEILNSVLQREPAPVMQKEPRVPPELAAICEKALRKRPADRYQSARDLAEEVQRFLSGAVVRSYEYSPWQLLVRFYHRNRASVLVGAAALVLFITGLTYYNIALYASREAERLQRQAVESANAQLTGEVYASTIVAAQRFVNDAVTERALDYLARCPKDGRGWEWGHLRRACSPLLSEAPHDPLKVGTVMALRCRFSDDDDRYVLSKWASGGAITIFDRTESEFIYYSELDVFLGFPQTTDFGPDPGHFTAGLDYTTVAYHDWVNGRTIRTFSVEDGWLWSFKISPDKRYAAGAAYNKDTSTRQLILWDFQTGAELQRHTLPPAEHAGYGNVPEQYLHYNIMFTIPFNIIGGFIDDSSRLVFSDDNVCILDIETGEIARKMPVRDSAFNVDPERGWIVYVRPDGTVGQWDFRNDVGLADLQEYTSPLEVVYGGLETPYIGIREHGDTWSVWEAETGRLLYRAKSDTPSLRSVDVANSEPVAATLANNTNLMFWQIRRSSANEVRPMAHDIFNPYAWPYHSYAVHPARDRLAVLTSQQKIQLWRFPGVELIDEWKPHDDKVMEMGFSADGTLMTTTCWDGTAKVWEASTGALLHEFAPEFDEACYTAAISPDGATIALGFGERSTTDRAQSLTLFYDLTTGALKERVDLAGNRVNKLAYGPDGTLLFVGTWGLNNSGDHSFVVYRTTDLTTPVARVNGIGWGDKVKFSPQGRYALLHGGSLNPVLFDMETLQVVYEIPKSQAMTLEFHPDGTRFVTAVHYTHRANIHRTSDGRILASLDGVLGPAFFSADGTELYTLTRNGEARIFRSQPWR